MTILLVIIWIGFSLRHKVAGHATLQQQTKNLKREIFAAEKFLARRVLEFWNLEFAAARSEALLLPATQRPFYCIHILSIRILAGF